MPVVIKCAAGFIELSLVLLMCFVFEGNIHYYKTFIATTYNLRIVLIDSVREFGDFS